MIRLGIIGCGGISKTYISALKYVPQFKLVSILDIREEKKRVAEENDAVFYTPNRMEEFLKSIDAAVISTPPYLHAKQTIQTLKNGKGVLCEKPMATNMNDARKMIEIAEKSKKVLMIASHSRYFPDLMDFIKNKKKYGEILEVKCDFVENLLEYTAEDWFYDKAKAGGGCLIDSGINAIDCLKAVLGEIRIIKAIAGYKPVSKKVSDVETSAEIWFKFGKDRNGKIDISWIADKEKRDITFRTRMGDYVIDYLRKSKNIGDFMIQEYIGVLYDFLDKLKKGDYVDRQGFESLKLVEEVYKIIKTSSKTQ